MAKKITLNYLEKVNHIVDCPCSQNCFLEVKSMLPPSSFSSVSPFLKKKSRYILGKYFVRKFELENKIALLEKANEHFDEIFVIAGKHPVLDPKQWFKRTHTKYVLSLELRNAEAKELRSHAETLSERALSLFPENDSIRWMYNKLKGKG